MARSRLVLRQPFFGALALGLELVEQESIGTMAVDGRRLIYAPSFLATLSDDEAEGVLAHEVLHCAYMHHTRRGARDAERWNDAADYAINRDLLEARFTLPRGRLYDPQFDGLGAEEIYAMLQAAAPKNGAGKPNGGNGGAAEQDGAEPAGGPATGQGQPNGGKPAPDSARCGGVIDAAPAHAPAELAAAEADMQSRVRQAIAVARAAGTLPGGIARLAAELDKPRHDWRAMLRRFVDESISRDFSWTRPNRRHLYAGRILPGSVPDRPSHIAAIVDTSGSIGARELAAFGAELQAMLDDGAADRLSVAYADTRIHRVDEFEAGDILAMKPAGGGGTAFRQPLAWAAEQGASAVIYMTDCYTSDWGTDPGSPVLWLATGDPRQARRAAAEAPFGESILLSD